MRKEPLGTVFHNDTLEYRMVVIDISDLDDIRYGIIGLSICTAQRAFRSAEQRGLPSVEKHIRRRPLSAIEYMSKFYPESSGDPFTFGDVVNSLQEHPLINVSAMDCKPRSLSCTLPYLRGSFAGIYMFSEVIWPANDDEDAVAAAKPHSQSAVTISLLVKKPSRV